MKEILSHKELKYLLIDSLKKYTEGAIYLSGNNPYKFNINKRLLQIFIHNVHETGRNRPNECRIQFQPQNKNFIEAKKSGLPVLFIGYYLKDNVFTAWNPFTQIVRINSKKTRTVSIYSRFSIQRKASKQGMAVYKDDAGQIVISFKPEFLGLYIENYAVMHKSSEKTLLKLIKKSEEVGVTEKDVGRLINIGRKRFTITHRAYKRNPTFQQIVYNEYCEKCAFCGIQLELVEAIHIIPHAHEKGSDDPRNGICLCALHHTAYDNGLIYFDSKYNIQVNDSKVAYLTKIKKDEGLQKFENLHFNKIKLPRSRAAYPLAEYIKFANSLRGINE